MGGYSHWSGVRARKKQARLASIAVIAAMLAVIGKERDPVLTANTSKQALKDRNLALIFCRGINP
jgi:hypothetical protein